MAADTDGPYQHDSGRAFDSVPHAGAHAGLRRGFERDCPRRRRAPRPGGPGQAGRARRDPCRAQEIQRPSPDLAAMTDPTNVLARDDVAYMTGFDVCVVVAMRSEVQHEIRRHYGGQGGVPTLGHFNTPKASAPPIAQVSVADMMTVLGGELDEVQVLDDEESTTSVFELKESADEAPVVKLVNMVLVDAIQKGASDIHWEDRKSTRLNSSHVAIS